MITKLQLASIQLKDFRCFEQATIDLDSSIVLICGKNGAGKTSLLEALHYGCYLRSFRTHLARELVALGKESFFIKIRSYKTVLENRNALLQQEQINADAYFVWTKTLWEHTAILQETRKVFLAQLEAEVNKMIACYIDENLSVSLHYQAKKQSD